MAKKGRAPFYDDLMAWHNTDPPDSAYISRRGLQDIRVDPYSGAIGVIAAAIIEAFNDAENYGILGGSEPDALYRAWQTLITEDPALISSPQHRLIEKRFKETHEEADPR